MHSAAPSRLPPPPRPAPYPQPRGYASATPRTLSPQVVSAAISRRIDLDDNPFERRSGRGRWVALFVFAALVGGGVGVAKVRPQAIPPAVARPVSHWFGVAQSAVASYLHPTPQGQSLAVAPVQAVPPPPAVTPIPPVPVANASEPSTGGPPVIDVSSLPVAHNESAAPKAAAATRVAGPAERPAPAERQAPAPRPVAHHASAPAAAPAAENTPAPIKAAAVKAAPAVAPPPPAAVTPPPAPGSLDDMIRKAVEAESKKKH